MDWADVRLFLAVVEHKSFNRAAHALAVGQPTMSRRIAALEQALGSKLFVRGLHGAELTAAGERLVLPAQRMAEWAGEAARQAAGADGAPEGLVRIAAPPGIAAEILAPFAAQLRRLLPRVRLQVRAAVDYVDLARGEADLALRGQPATRDELVSLASYDQPFAAYVSPAYARRKPKSLAEVDWIVWAPPYDALPPGPQLRAAIGNFTPAFSSDDFLVQMAAAEAGVGACVLPIRKRLRLVPLPLDLGTARKVSMHLVCAKSAAHIPRIRAVADALMSRLSHAA